MSPGRTTTRAAALAAALTTTAGALVLATALPASAHVTVTSPDATPGGFGKLVVRVPSESDTARTTKITVTLPEATPFAFVSTMPQPGWTVSTTETKLAEPVKAEGFTLTKAVSTVTWTAEPGQGLRPHEFAEFSLSLGPFPSKAGTLSFPATQTYSDGEVTAWDQPTTGSEEPEHPAPTLDVRAAATQQRAASTATEAAAAGQDPDDLARWLGGGGLALGLLAVGIALSGRTRRREATA